MILITGATGNIGSEVVKLLSAAGQPVRALVRNPQKARMIQGPGVEIAVGDLGKPDTLDAALQGVTKAFLLSSVDPRQVELQGNFIRSAQRAGVQQVIKSSALGADLNAPAEFMRWHAQTEEQLKRSGLAFTILRPHVFMQAALGFAPTIAATGTFYGPLQKEVKISTVDTRDVAAVAVGVLTEPGHEGQGYAITGPEALSYDDMAEKIAAVIGKPVTYVETSSSDARQGLLQAGLPEWLADSIVAMYGMFSTGEYAYVTDVVSRVGKKEPITFDQFAKEFAGVFMGS